MNAIYLDVKVYGGADIEKAARQAIQTASILGITVCFDFNGVRCQVHGGDIAKEVAESQQVCQRRGFEWLGMARSLPAETRAAILAETGHPWIKTETAHEQGKST